MAEIYDNEQITKEQAILEAAEREFMIKGYDGAKTTSIAAAAGVTHAMLHYYFRTKENLFDQVFESKVEAMAQLVSNSAFRSDLPFLQKLRSIVENHFDFVVNNPELPRFVINELISKPERRDMLVSKIGKFAPLLVSTLQTEIDLSVEKGEICRINSVDLMLDIVSLNLFAFISLPIFEPFAMRYYGGKDEFLAARKAENVEIIMKRLTVR